ncbi:MAG TPA: nucleotidyltransferase family protein [Fimbriimonadaceae bacterium]|nr:nucleotidyltransferase family protein [Fimbriimonadaceae bacterium]
MRRVSAIVPAAGLSSRFGGPNKLLEPFGETTVVGSVVACLDACGLPIVVVTGRDAALVAGAAHPARSVFNASYDEGLGTSIGAGVRSSEEADGYLIALGDMPGLRRDVVAALLDAFERASEGTILAPVYAAESNRPGHPVLFDASYRPALEALGGDEGAKGIVSRNRDRLVLVPVEGALPDIDRPDDLR